MLSVLSLFMVLDFQLSSVALWSSFAFVCKHYIFLSTTKSDMRYVFLLLIITKGRGWRKLTSHFRLKLSVKVTSKIFSRCEINMITCSRSAKTANCVGFAVY